MSVDPTKSQVKFDYGEQCKVIKTVKLIKFKKDKGDLLDSPLTASLLLDENSRCHYLVVRLAATHKTIFSGMILKGKSQVKVLNKKENLEILLFGVEKEKHKL